MTAVAIDIAKGGGGAAISEKEHQGMGRFRGVDMEVPEHIRIGGVSGRVSFVTAVEGRKFDGISDKEDGLVIEDPVIVTLGGLEFDGPAMEITDGVCGTRFGANGGDSRKDLRLLPDAIEEIGVSDVGDVVRDLEVSSSTDSLGMNHSLGNSFSGEVRQGLNQLGVLKQDQPTALLVPDLDTGVISGERNPLGEGVEVGLFSGNHDSVGGKEMVSFGNSCRLIGGF